MPNIIAVNSFRRGVGRSNLAANLAVLLALFGQRVGVVDANLQSPGLHVLFNQPETGRQHTLNAYLWGISPIEQTAREVTGRLGQAIPGQIFLVPASTEMDDIKRALRQGYNVDLLNSGFQTLMGAYSLDTLLVDTRHGLNEESLYAIAIADTLLLLLRTDKQDFWGTGITLQVARKLHVPRIMLVVNEAPALFDSAAIKAKIEQAYNCNVAAVLSHLDEWMALASSGLFVLRYPNHAATAVLKHIARELMAQ